MHWLVVLQLFPNSCYMFTFLPPPLVLPLLLTSLIAAKRFPCHQHNTHGWEYTPKLGVKSLGKYVKHSKLWLGKLSLFWLPVIADQSVSHSLSFVMAYPLLGHLQASIITNITIMILSQLQAISLELPSCDLLTNDGGKLQVQHSYPLLFSTFSPPSPRCKLTFSQFSAPSLAPSLHKLDQTQPCHFPAQRIFWGQFF